MINQNSRTLKSSWNNFYFLSQDLRREFGIAFILAALGFGSQICQASLCDAALAKAQAAMDSAQFDLAYKEAKTTQSICTHEKIRSAPAFVLAGVAKLKLKQNKEALSEFVEAKAIDPKSEVIMLNLCSTYAELASINEALEACKKLIEVTSSEEQKGKANFTIGKMLFFNKDFKGNKLLTREAEPYFLNAAKQMPKYGDTYFYLANFKGLLDKDGNGAKELFKKGCNLGSKFACASSK